MKFNVTESRLTTALGLLATGAQFVAPRWLAWPLAGLCFIGVIGVLGAGVEFRNGQFAAPYLKSLGPRLKAMWPQIMMVFGAMAFVIGLIAVIRPQPQTGTGGPQAEGYGFVTPPDPHEAPKPAHDAPPLPQSGPPAAENVASKKSAKPVTVRPKVLSGTKSVSQFETEDGSGLVTENNVPIEKTFVQPTALTGLSNDQIRKRVASLANGLRNLEQRYHDEQLAISVAPFKESSESEQRAETQKRRSHIEKLHEDEQREFRDLYLFDARDLLKEIKARAGRRPEGATQPPGNWVEGLTALNSGIISDHTPLAELAEFLEAYVKAI